MELIDKEFKVFAFINAFWTQGKGMGGGDTRAIAIFKALKLKGVDIEIVTSNMGFTNYRNHIDVKYTIIPFSFTDKFGLPISYIFRTIIACFLPQKVNKQPIFYSTSDFLPDVFPAFAAKVKDRKIKWVQLIFHLIPPNRFISHYAQQISFFFIKRFADLIIVDNNILKEDLVCQGFDIRKIEFNPPGIDVGFFKCMKKNHKRYDAVSMGRIHTSKGIFDLVKIWKYVCKLRPDAKLAIIGTGDEEIKLKLEKKIEEAHLSQNIELLGFLENDEAFSIVNSCKLFVSASHEEGFGIAILEAMACGLPVIAWNLPVYSEVFPRGLIQIEENNFKDFSKAIYCLLSDEKKYSKFRKDALDLSLRYNWDEIAEKEMNLIKQMIT
ncbi:MAG: hypothetical protein A2W22_05050 [Candidatus Levybacteria bacterium RBG_16_35_11]|nr:MAG: hypothetical protein A2W22_05050 [Candidatus Levybacteria bacterium RBG_16_35_11]